MPAVPRPREKRLSGSLFQALQEVKSRDPALAVSRPGCKAFREPFRWQGAACHSAAVHLSFDFLDGLGDDVADVLARALVASRTTAVAQAVMSRRRLMFLSSIVVLTSLPRPTRQLYRRISDHSSAPALPANGTRIMCGIL